MTRTFVKASIIINAGCGCATWHRLWSMSDLCCCFSLVIERLYGLLLHIVHHITHHIHINWIPEIKIEIEWLQTNYTTSDVNNKLYMTAVNGRTIYFSISLPKGPHYGVTEISNIIGRRWQVIFSTMAWTITKNRLLRNSLWYWWSIVARIIIILVIFV